MTAAKKDDDIENVTFSLRELADSIESGMPFIITHDLVENDPLQGFKVEQKLVDVYTIVVPSNATETEV